MMRIIITGAAGFVGSNLADALLRLRHEVIGVDNLSQGSLDNLDDCIGHPSFTFVNGDICDRQTFGGIASKTDCIVHLAAFKIPRYGNSLKTLQVNVHGTRAVLDVAAEVGCKVVFASTSDCYGRNPVVPFTEESELWMGPSNVKRWAYAISKMYDEQLCFAYNEASGLRFVIVRLFGGYGPRQNLTWWGGPQSVFIGAALRNEPMEIHGDGSQTRSFTYVTDHVDGIVRCIEGEAANGQVFNLGSTLEVSIVELARLIWQLVGGGEPKLRRVSYRTFGKYEDVRRRVPDIAKARRVLGFEPKVSLEEGLRRTIQWQRRVGRA